MLLIQNTPATPRSPLFPYPTLFRSIGEYVNMITASTLAVILFFAAWHPTLGGPAFISFVVKIEMNAGPPSVDRKSTRLNSSHLGISYAVFCLKKKKMSAMYSQGHVD